VVNKTKPIFPVFFQPKMYDDCFDKSKKSKMRDYVWDCKVKDLKIVVQFTTRHEENMKIFEGCL